MSFWTRRGMTRFGRKRLADIRQDRNSKLMLPVLEELLKKAARELLGG